MSDKRGYWVRKTLSRRAALRSAGVALGGLTALSLLSCGGNDNKGGEKNETSGGPALDPTKGKRGGKLIIQAYGDPGGGLELFKIRNAGVHQMAGFTHDGLLEHRSGTPAFDGYDLQPQPNLAQTMPEQPDTQTYVYKLRPAKFHNGRPLTSEDVKWSYEKYAFDSPWRNVWPWLEK